MKRAPTQTEKDDELYEYNTRRLNDLIAMIDESADPAWISRCDKVLDSLCPVDGDFLGKEVGCCRCFAGCCPRSHIADLLSSSSS